jgi:hypothetical protein
VPVRIAWVHPSWRDLVIERLADDAAGRREFLAACGVEGALLALSVAGGRAGERRLPLLRADADWDALADGLHVLLRDADDPDLVRLLTALAEAAGAGLDSERGREVQALACSCLEQVRDRWDAGHRPLALAPLEAWFEVSGRLPEPPRAPAIAPSWIELLPGTDLSDPLGAAEWLGLTELLAQHAPEKLRALGFPESQRERLRALTMEAARRLPESDEPGPLLLVLERAARLSPDFAHTTYGPEQPANLPVLPPLEFSDTIVDLDEHLLVDRVLRDL